MKNKKIIKISGTALAVMFAVITVVMLLAQGQTDRLFLAVATVFLSMLPAALEKLLLCEVSLPVYIFALLYAVGPMMGHCWYLYYIIPWWDKLLHISGGVMFAILGAYLFDRLTGEKSTLVARTIFALCFSMAIAVAWEFFEFGADRFLGMDMQDDTVVYGLTSYLLGDTMGVTGSIADIHSVSVNGVTLPVDGYIEIGLIDSMLDMLLETVGAIVACLFFCFDRGKHPVIQDKRIMPAVSGDLEKRDDKWQKDM